MWLCSSERVGTRRSSDEKDEDEDDDGEEDVEIVAVDDDVVVDDTGKEELEEPLSFEMLKHPTRSMADDDGIGWDGIRELDALES